MHRAANRPALTWLGPVLGTLLCLVAAITGTGWMIVGGVYWASGGNAFQGLSASILAVGFLLLPFLVWEEYGSHLLAATGRIDIYNRAQLVGRLVGVGLVLCALAVGWGVEGVLGATVVMQAIIAIRGIGYLTRQATGAMRPSMKVAREMLRAGLALHPSAIAGALVLYGGVLVVTYYRGPSQTAYFQLASQLMLTIVLVPQAASLVMYRYTTEVGADRAWAVQRRAIAGVIALATVAGALAAALAPWIIRALAGAEFAPAVGILQVLVLALPGFAFSVLMTPQWIARGLFWQLSALMVFVAAVNVAANLLLVPRYGAHAAAWTTVGTFGILALADGWLALRCEGVFRSSERRT